ncbi:MAG: dihydroorotase family protein [Ignavibacteriales bacterium]|nr:dihydroorotase family protein [Ignavibacteriales bacterium]MCF8304985.1 dihydroorotase family protein [Ignavibacteriales bacterium]MCF8314674.1 dihydroorotase family protein [Ignavibacteriales bacterium]MCF8436289.1 dihydroorotase family protein [Ignavibacteriales bacterium]
MDKKERHLLNVFVPTGANYLRLVNITFDEKIIEMTPLLRGKVAWEEISDEKKLSAFIMNNMQGIKRAKGDDIDGNFAFAMPGGVDPTVYFSLAGPDRFADLTIEAAAGGTTAIVDMPYWNGQRITNDELLTQKREFLLKNSFVDFGLWRGLELEDLSKGMELLDEIEASVNLGAAGVYLYLTEDDSKINEFSRDDYHKLAKFLKGINYPIAMVPEDLEITKFRAFRAHRLKYLEKKDFMYTHDQHSESEAVWNMADVSSRTAVKFFITSITTELGVNALKSMRRNKRIRLFSCTTNTHLMYTQEELPPEDKRHFKCIPPLRHNEDREALWKGLSRGLIDVVGSDHKEYLDIVTPEKAENYWLVTENVQSASKRLPVLLNEGLVKDRLTLENIVDVFSKNAADYFNMNKGDLRTGKDADIVLVGANPDITKPLSDSFRFDVLKTLVRGSVVYDCDRNGEVPKGHGQYAFKNR